MTNGSSHEVLRDLQNISEATPGFPQCGVCLAILCIPASVRKWWPCMRIHAEVRRGGPINCCVTSVWSGKLQVQPAASVLAPRSILYT